jgi:hypothetical protein
MTKLDEAHRNNSHMADAALSSLRATSSQRRPHIKPFHIDTIYRDVHQLIDSTPSNERCAAFGLEPHNDTSPRRIFFGSMIADENMDVLTVSAIETHGIFEVVALVESNTTYKATPRTMRFRDTPEAELLQHSNMFGNQTRVIIDYWLEDMPDLIWMDREAEQRSTITTIWKEAGMMERDIGIVADIDEIVSRDFLVALQVCDFPQLRLQLDQPSCQTPKIVLSTIQFEGSPFCIKDNNWFHPDVILVSADNRQAQRSPAFDFFSCVALILDLNRVNASKESGTHRNEWFPFEHSTVSMGNEQPSTGRMTSISIPSMCWNRKSSLCGQEMIFALSVAREIPLLRIN